MAVLDTNILIILETRVEMAIAKAVALAAALTQRCEAACTTRSTLPSFEWGGAV